MAEVVGAFVGFEYVEDLSDLVPLAVSGSLCGIAQRQPEIPYTGRRDLGIGCVGCALYQLCRVVRRDCFGDGHFPILVVYGTDLLRFTGPRQNLDQDGPVGYGAEIQNRCGTLRRRHDLDLSHWCATAR